MTFNEALVNLRKTTMPEFDAGYAVTIPEFWDNFVEPRLPNEKTVLYWNKLLMEYINENDPIFVIRAFSNTNKTPRRDLLTRTNKKFLFTYSDNGFAKFIAKLVYSNIELDYADFKKYMSSGEMPVSEFIGSLEKSRAFYPAQKFDYGEYKLAHIIDSGKNFCVEGKLLGMQEICDKYFPAGNIEDWKFDGSKYIRDLLVSDEAKSIIIAHYLRFIDPMNYFLTPKPMRNGISYHKCENGISDIAEYSPLQVFARERFSELYGKSYDEFLKLIMITDNGNYSKNKDLNNDIGIRWQKFSLESKNNAKEDYNFSKSVDISREYKIQDCDVKARYYSNRLIFYRDIIEPLGDNDIFECITPEGTFAMSKKDFYRVFSNVANNVKCYIRDGKYSYSKTPEKARQFLI